jgi:hypothetical protein
MAFAAPTSVMRKRACACGLRSKAACRHPAGA